MSRYRLHKGRVHGAMRTLEQRARSATEAAIRADLAHQPMLAASLRGKVTAYKESYFLVEALENDRRLPRRRGVR